MRVVIVNQSSPATVTELSGTAEFMAAQNVFVGEELVYYDQNAVPSVFELPEPLCRTVTVKRRRVDMSRGEIRLLVEDSHQADPLLIGEAHDACDRRPVVELTMPANRFGSMPSGHCRHGVVLTEVCDRCDQLVSQALAVVEAERPHSFGAGHILIERDGWPEATVDHDWPNISFEIS